MSDSFPPAKNIYHEPNGCNLLNPENYPMEVKAYLEKEKEILSMLKPYFRTLIEVGCFDGRYQLWAHRFNRKYVGIDINDTYLEEGKHRAEFYNIPKGDYEFFNLNAQNLFEIGDLGTIFRNTPTNNLLVVFPFNCLGNIPNVAAVIDSLNKLKLAYFISNFNTTEEATAVRNTYYNNCRYDSITQDNERDGIRFKSNDGLNSIAYDSNFLFENFVRHNPNAKLMNITGIGIGVINLNRLFYPTSLRY